MFSQRDSILLKIKQIKPLKNYEIAKILGVEQSTVGRGNSLQFINALKLLLENLQLKDRLDKVEAAQRTLAQLAGPTSPYITNENPSSIPQTPGMAVPPEKYKFPRARSPRQKPKP